MSDQPFRLRPLLSWRDYPALLELQRLLGEVERAAELALERVQGTLDDRSGMAKPQEREVLTLLIRRMEAAHAAASEAAEILFRFRRGNP